MEEFFVYEDGDRSNGDNVQARSPAGAAQCFVDHYLLHCDVRDMCGSKVIIVETGIDEDDYESFTATPEISIDWYIGR